MDLISILQNNIIGFLIGIGGTFLLNKIFPLIKKYIRLKIIEFKKDTKAFILEKVQDPEYRKIITALILKAQKELKEGTGKDRFEYVKKEALEKIKRWPQFAQDFIGDLIQMIYDELIDFNDLSALT